MKYGAIELVGNLAIDNAAPTTCVHDPKDLPSAALPGQGAKISESCGLKNLGWKRVDWRFDVKRAGGAKAPIFGDVQLQLMLEPIDWQTAAFHYFGGLNFSYSMPNRFHQEILKIIQENAGKPRHDEFLSGYMGNDHVRYDITNPVLREIAREWMRAHRDMEPQTFAALLDSLIKGESTTEKMMAGILMDYSSKPQRDFNPDIFNDWLEHLVGWAEVDTLCTGEFIRTQLPAYWPKWKKLILRLAKDSNINKRRASLVLFCSPLSRIKDDAIGAVALQIVTKLRAEKDVMITKAISWVLRSMIKHYRDIVSRYVDENADALPRIAVRETLVKLDTGKKTKSRSSTR